MGSNARNVAITSPSNVVWTVVLVGLTGNGKSATGNSILGRKAFKSMASSSGVTSTCELQQTVLRDGQIINVIDTPGLLDISADSEFVRKEIVKCMNLAQDGIHAFLLVFSVRTPFTQEEEEAIRNLKNMFGSKIVDYMIPVFTGGDVLEENGNTLEDYLAENCPQALKEILTQCKNRRVLFDNRTKDEHKKAQQVQQLLSLINMVTVQSGGQPYTSELLVGLQKGSMKLRDQEEEVDALKGYSKQEILDMKTQMQREYEELQKRTMEMIEMKFKATSRLEQQLEEERAARQKAEDEVSKLRKEKKSEPGGFKCPFL